MPWTVKTVTDGKNLLSLMKNVEYTGATKNIAVIDTPLGRREFKRGSWGGLKISAEVQRAVFGSYIFGRRAVRLVKRANGEQAIETIRSLDYGARPQVCRFSWANVVQAVYFDSDIHDIPIDVNPTQLEFEREVKGVWVKQFVGDAWEIFAHVDMNNIRVNATDYMVIATLNGVRLEVCLRDFMKDPYQLSPARMMDTINKAKGFFGETDDDFEAFADDFDGDADAMETTLERLLTPNQSDSIPQVLRKLMKQYFSPPEIVHGARVSVWEGLISFTDYHELKSHSVDDSYSYLKGQGNVWTCAVFDNGFLSGKRVFITVIEGGE